MNPCRFLMIRTSFFLKNNLSGQKIKVTWMRAFDIVVF